MRRKTYHGRRASLSLADLERAIGYVPHEAQTGPRLDRPCRIHVHSRLHRLPDCEAVSFKYVLDALVSAGLLEDDSRRWIPQPPTFTDEKIPSDQEESTTVTFYPTEC